jgi:pantothenate kinase
MQFKKLVTKKNALLKETDLKLIRAIEDIISVQEIFDKMPKQVQDLITERQAIRNSGGGTNG